MSSNKIRDLPEPDENIINDPYLQAAAEAVLLGDKEKAKEALKNLKKAKGSDLLKAWFSSDLLRTIGEFPGLKEEDLEEVREK